MYGAIWTIIVHGYTIYQAYITFSMTPIKLQEIKPKDVGLLQVSVYNISTDKKDRERYLLNKIDSVITYLFMAHVFNTFNCIW